MKRVLLGIMSVALAAAGAISLNSGSNTVAAAPTTSSIQTSFVQRGPGSPDGTHAGGQVASVSGSTITVTGRDGASQSIATTASTTFELDGSSSSLSALAAGQFIRAEGTTDSAGTFTATTVTASTTPPQGRPGGHRP